MSKSGCRERYVASPRFVRGVSSPFIPGPAISDEVWVAVIAIAGLVDDASLMWRDIWNKWAS
jgi:hypothetical protein